MRRVRPDETTDPALRSLIGRILKRHHVMALGTIRADGYPQVTTVTYANDDLDLYFACDKRAQKVRNIRRTSKVSLAIDRAFRDWSKIQGLSMAGEARILRSRSEIQHALSLLQEKFSQWAEIDMDELQTLTFVRVVPQVISVLDYSKGFGHADLIVTASAGNGAR